MESLSLRSARIPFDYRLKLVEAAYGATRLRLACVENLDAAIDGLFEYLEKAGDPSLLESLCPYFATLWPSARALAERMASQDPEDFRGKSVLEAGCGLALPSLLAAKLGARAVATDFHPDVPAFLERNLALNGLSPALVEHASVAWSDESTELGLFDWVVASDVLYERHHPPLLASACDRHVTPDGRVLVADPGRPYVQEFVDEMRRRGFACADSVRRIDDAGVAKDIFLLEFSRPGRVRG